MKSSSPLTCGLLRNHARHRGPKDLTIIPMLDVMVILAFFLIFTAVFSRTSILEVNLPEPECRLHRRLSRSSSRSSCAAAELEVAERNSGVLQTIPATTSGPDVVRLSQYLRAGQGRATRTRRTRRCWSPNDVDYDTIVQVMDAVSVRQRHGRRQAGAHAALPADRARGCADMIRAGLLRDARHGKVGGSHGPLTLVPMIDILTILVVYLLVHAADAEILSNPRNVSMPMSVSDLKAARSDRDHRDPRRAVRQRGRGRLAWRKSSRAPSP